MQAMMRATMITALILRLRFMGSFVLGSNPSGFLLLGHQARNGITSDLEFHVVGLDPHNQPVVAGSYDSADDAAARQDLVARLQLPKQLCLLLLLPPHGNHHDEVEDRETDPHHDEKVRRAALLGTLLLQYQTVDVHFNMCRKSLGTNCLSNLK